MTKPTPLQVFCDRWADGCGNEICDRRNTLCLGRGNVPCDVLFIGEAPGESENAIGQPFVGPAGQELDRWVKQAAFHRRYGQVNPKVGEAIYKGKNPKNEPLFTGTKLRIAFTNLLACLPREKDGRKAVEPLASEVRQCSTRLLEFVMLCDGHPTEELGIFADAEEEGIEMQGELKLIVTVGSQARDYLDRKMYGSIKLHRPIRSIHILHPAYVLRQNTAQRQILAQRQIVTLKSALEEL